MIGIVRHRFTIFTGLVLAASTARADCECPPNSVEEAVLGADRVFHGEVVSAAITEDDARTIELVVDVGETIRGNPEKQYRLTTALPESCGIPVRLGFHDVYVLRPGDTDVSGCTGSGRVAYMRYPLLGTAIELVDLPVANARGAQRLLSEQFYPGFDRATIEEFFDLVERIDPLRSTITRRANRIEYRGIAILFRDGKYERVEIR